MVGWLKLNFSLLPSFLPNAFYRFGTKFSDFSNHVSSFFISTFTLSQLDIEFYSHQTRSRSSLSSPSSALPPSPFFPELTISLLSTLSSFYRKSTRQPSSPLNLPF